MRRFFVQTVDPSADKITITGQEAGHMVRVLRMKSGDRFVLMDGGGSRYQAVIDEAAPGHVTARLEGELEMPPVSPVRITLFQALLKSGKMDFVIEKCSELGVDRICPFTSERTVVKIDRAKGPGRLRHWQGVARSAAVQSGRRVPAETESAASLRELLLNWKGHDACKIILWEDERSLDLKSALRSCRAVTDFIGVVGPEGGFSPVEISVARESGFEPVSMGGRILRAETAAVALTALVQFELGDLGLVPGK